MADHNCTSQASHEQGVEVPTQDLLGLLPGGDIHRLERRAFANAAAAWDRYHASVQRGDPLETTNHLNGLAWQAENWWRALSAASRNASSAP